MNLPLKYAIYSCLSNNTALFEEFINVFLTPDLLQLQQYSVVVKHLSQGQVALYIIYHPGPIGEVHLGVTLPPSAASTTDAHRPHAALILPFAALKAFPKQGPMSCLSTFSFFGTEKSGAVGTMVQSTSSNQTDLI